MIRAGTVRMGVVFLAVLLSMPAAHATDAITGRASVIDGDTIEIHGTRIRLHGIDAPEARQTCKVKGKTWRCGRQSALALADRIGGRPVSCRARDKDRYNRIVAVCHAGAEDLNGWMVAQGWAMAYRQFSADYIGQEEGARSARLGIWRGEVVPPWDWRGGVRLESNPLPEARDCRIKGNIGRNGDRIYHVPGGAYYSRTRIDIAKGERWFCSEAEASAAGWRRARR